MTPLLNLNLNKAFVSWYWRAASKTITGLQQKVW